MMNTKRVCCFLCLFLLFTNTALAQINEGPNIVWMEYTVSEKTGKNMWQDLYIYCNGRIKKLDLMASDEEGFLLPNILSPSEICIATKREGSDSYSIKVLKNGSLTLQFSQLIENVFTFLGLHGQNIYFVERELVENESCYMYSVSIKTPDTEHELFRYKSKYWIRPSVNQDGQVLFCITDGIEEKILMYSHDGETKEIVGGSFPVWLDNQSFLYVLDGRLFEYDLTTLSRNERLIDSKRTKRINLSPFDCDALYLSANKEYLIYGVSVEDKLLGFISTGYFHKSWNVLSLLSGEEYTVGVFLESYDNIHVY